MTYTAIALVALFIRWFIDAIDRIAQRRLDRQLRAIVGDE